MILYHAGPQWVHVVEALVPRTDLAKVLCDHHGFTQCMLYEPFGTGRGAVIAKRDHMVVMDIGADGDTHWYAVAPTKELQDLIWSFSNGFAGQWSTLELKIITGHGDWPALLEMAGRQFSDAACVVERAIAGPAKDAPSVQELPDFDGNAIELPPDYLHPLSGTEVIECVH